MSNELVRNTPQFALANAHQSNGDLSRFTPVERKIFYLEMCKHYGFDPMSFPFDYIEEGGKIRLYINQSGCAQMRYRLGVSVRIIDRQLLDDMWIVVAEAKLCDRTEEATGAASILDKYNKTSPTHKANALKKAETQARRRVTLAICGFGFDDDYEGNGSKVINAKTFDPPGEAF